MWAAGAVVVFVVSVCVHGWFAGVSHDEGVTLDVALGRIDPELVRDFRPVPVAELVACVDGSRPRSAGGVVDELSRRVNPYPPAYFLLQNAWTSRTGVHRVLLRVPSVLCGLATLLGLALLARRLVPDRAAPAWVAVLAAASPWFASISTFARPYAFVLAVGTWSTVVALKVADGRASTRTRALWVALSLLGLHGLYHYGFVVAWQAAFLAVCAWRVSGADGPAGPSPRAARRRELGALALMGAAVTAGFLPWAVTRLPAHLGLTATMPSYYKGDVVQGLGAGTLRALWTYLLGESVRGALNRVLAVTFLALGACTLLVAIRRVASRRRAPRDVVASTFLATAPLYPAAILVGDLLHGTRTLTITKTTFMLFPLLLLAVTAAWCSLRRRRVRDAGLAAWLLLALVASTATAISERRYEDHHRIVARRLAAQDRPDHLVLFNSMVRGHAIPLLLTLREEGVGELRAVLAPPKQLDGVLERALADPGVRRITLLNLHSVYPHSVETYCTREQIDALANCARRGGWRISRATPEEVLASAEDPTGDRLLDILSPVW